MFLGVLKNELVVGSGIALLLAVFGIILSKNKLWAWGLAASKFLNSKIGSAATEKLELWVEKKLNDFIAGMKADNNEAKK